MSPSRARRDWRGRWLQADAAEGKGQGRAAARPYQGLPTDFMHAAEEGPFFGRGREAGAHGVFTDVLPFLGVALAAAEAVVQAAALEGAGVGMGFGKAVFPKGDPFFDGEFQVVGRAEEVEVVGHEHVVADEPRGGGVFPNLMQGALDGGLREPAFALVGADGEEDPVGAAEGNVDTFGGRMASGFAVGVVTHGRKVIGGCEGVAIGF